MALADFMGFIRNSQHDYIRCRMFQFWNQSQAILVTQVAIQQGKLPRVHRLAASRDALSRQNCPATVIPSVRPQAGETILCETAGGHRSE